jgi:hypothetical protein
MSVSTELFEQVVAAVTPATDEAELRRQFPDVRITVCNDDDLPARLTAVRETPAARFFFIDAGEHCVKLSSDAATASGIVVGLLGDD